MAGIAIRPRVLRAYYAVTFGKGAAAAQGVAEAFADASFEEYFALRRLQYPTMSRRNAAASAPRADLRAFADALPDDAPPPAPLHVLWDLSGKAVDVSKKKPPAGADMVLLKGASTLRGFSAFARCKGLRSVWARLSSATFSAPARRLAVDMIDAGDCKPAFMRALLEATSARGIVWMDWGRAPVDLTPLARHTRLATLYAAGPLIRNVRALRGLPLEELTLGRVRVDGALGDVLANAGKTLRALHVVTGDDVAPSALPLDEMPALERVSIGTHETHRDAWMSLALARRGVRFDFMAPPGPPSKGPALEIVETYRDVEILQVTKGKTIDFRIESDVADAVGFADGNGDLEDELAPIARAAKKKIAWGSEADTLVATCKDVATCRWVIDRAAQLAKPAAT
jgi:hypothetical protein